jgi:1,5-anhydro-D-fructose reductase (1,5-anhydro-D-mannitol-forming)
MQTLRWALVGTGTMASRLATAVEHTEGSTVAAVVSRSREAGARFGREHGVAEVHGDLQGALGEAGVDIVYIGSPNALHASQALVAIRSGRHVLCDKPLGVSSAEAREVASAAEAAGITLSVVLQNRHHPTSLIVRDAVRDGQIGRVRLVRGSIGFGYEELVGWRADLEQAGAAAVFNLGIHLYDLIGYLLDARAREIKAIVEPGGVSLDRTALALARYEGGTLAYLQVSQELTEDDVRIELVGERGMIGWDGWMAPYRSGEVVISTPAGVSRFHSECPDAYERLVRAFAEAVRGGNSPQPSVRDTVHGVEIAEAVITSGRTGRAVELARPTVVEPVR